jgi:hypothetical protein
LKYLLETRRFGRSAFAAAVFSALDQSGRTTEGVAVLAEPELAELLIPHAPPAVLALLLPALVPSLETSLEGRLPISESQWAALFAAGADVPHALLSLVPSGVVAAAVRAACASSNDAALALLWRRFPAVLSDFVQNALTPTGEPGFDLERLLATTPEGASVRLIATLDDVDALLRARAASLMALRRHLHRELGRHAVRSEAFRETYVLFDELERRCARVAG